MKLSFNEAEIHAMQHKSKPDALRKNQTTALSFINEQTLAAQYALRIFVFYHFL